MLQWSMVFLMLACIGLLFGFVLPGASSSGVELIRVATYFCGGLGLFLLVIWGGMKALRWSRGA